MESTFRAGNKTNYERVIGNYALMQGIREDSFEAVQAGFIYGARNLPRDWRAVQKVNAVKGYFDKVSPEFVTRWPQIWDRVNRGDDITTVMREEITDDEKRLSRIGAAPRVLGPAIPPEVIPKPDYRPARPGKLGANMNALPSEGGATAEGQPDVAFRKPLSAENFDASDEHQVATEEGKISVLRGQVRGEAGLADAAAGEATSPAVVSERDRQKVSELLSLADMYPKSPSPELDRFHPDLVAQVRAEREREAEAVRKKREEERAQRNSQLAGFYNNTPFADV